MAALMYRALDSSRIVATADRLHRRIAERFPDSGLSAVTHEVVDVARESDTRVAALVRPHWPLRVTTGVVIAILLVAGAVAASSGLRLGGGLKNLSDFLQILESGVNDLVFVGVFFFFLVTLEGRLKRRSALRGLHELRSLAHVVDMHQVSKDPAHLTAPLPATATSAAVNMTQAELSRYLDYCSELLSLVGKLAALYAQALPDAVVYGAVNDVETLVGTLSQKVWQKIDIMNADRGASRAPDRAASDSVP